MTTEIWPRPVRVKKSGTWAWIDTTLTEEGGAVKPKVIKGDLSLPAGGGQSATTTFEPTTGKSLALSWPTALPKPKLEGSRATYINAAGPGADLVITARATGFRYDVVLRTPPTGAPEFKISLKEQGLSLREASDGRLRVTDAENRNIAVAQSPSLRGNETAKTRPSKPGAVDTRVITEGGQQTLTLKPDATYLADPATAYPVTIQSAFSITPTADADVSTIFPDWPNGDGGWLKAGTESDGSKSRAYLKFDTSPLVGQNLSKVTLSLLNTEGPSCGAAVGDGIQVRRVTSAWSASTVTWLSQPTNTTENAVVNRASVGGSCAPVPMDWDITAMARQWTGDVANYGVVLMSPTERKSANYRTYLSADNTEEPNPPKLIASFSPAGGPVTVSPAGPDGVEVFTAPDNWGTDTLQKAESQAHALGSARDRVTANTTVLAPPYLDMVTGQIIVPAAAAEGRDLGAAPLIGTAYLSNGLTDWTAPGEYSGADANDDGEGPASLTEEYDFSPNVPDVANSASRLDSIVEEVLDLDTNQLPGADGLIAARVWPERNQVLVQASAASPELRQALATRYGVNTVAIWLSPSAIRPSADVGVSSNRQEDVNVAAGDSRRNDTDDHVNGGSVFLSSQGGECTTGFGWGTSTDKGLVTAGHCMPRNADPWARTVTGSILGGLSGSAPNYHSTWLLGVGSAKMAGQPTFYGDGAHLILAKPSTGSIFVGGRDSTMKRSVAGRWPRRAVEGDLYCVGGAETGQSCNWKVTDLGWKVEYREGTILRWGHRGVRSNRCTARGDSGGPVYTIRPENGYVVAKGIHSGSTNNVDGTPRTSDCVEFFTDIWDVSLAFGDRITKRN
ncbi:DNRLRE domain-containing protein [Nonomuraea dietziae]|uniref:DNRLRE domain-containing protein n=1 Tax=Nonomuraea dietziae TaxID=65515 RepID=UPI0033CFEB7A